jgi:hypothetical protein
MFSFEDLRLLLWRGRPLWRPRDRKIRILIKKGKMKISAVFDQTPGSVSGSEIHLIFWIRIHNPA